MSKLSLFLLAGTAALFVSTADSAAASTKKSMPADVRNAWDSSYGDARGGLRLVEEINRGNLQYVSDVNKAIEYFDQVVRFDEACKKFGFPDYTDGVSSSTTSEACDAATKWKPAAMTYFPPTIKDQLEEELKDARGTVERDVGHVHVGDDVRVSSIAFPGRILFECTFCVQCADAKLSGRCPNCGGELVARPRRPQGKLADNPASRHRVHKPLGCIPSP